jgi:hypothetical protein
MQRLRREVSWYTGLARNGADEDFAELPEVMTSEAYSFYGVDVYDEATGFVLHEVYLENFEGNKLPEYIREKIQDVEADRSEPLDRTRLMEHPEFMVFGKWDKSPIRLRHESSVLPYRIHGGRELDLMLKGRKPLSVFSHVEAASVLSIFLSKYFEPLVGCGELVSARLDDGSTAPTSMFAHAPPAQIDSVLASRIVAMERIQAGLIGTPPTLH